MSNLIDRQAAIKAFEKDIMGGLNWDYILAHMPSAQPEIIRCKDCKYMTEHYDTDGNAPYWTCAEWDSGTDYDGFCSYGERADE